MKMESANQVADIRETYQVFTAREAAGSRRKYGKLYVCMQVVSVCVIEQEFLLLFRFTLNRNCK